MKKSQSEAKIGKKPSEAPAKEAETTGEAALTPPTEAETERWEAEAARRAGEGGKWNVPWSTLMGEAVDVARFAEEHWAPQRDSRTGAETRPGLSAVESRLPKSVIRELLVLQQLAQRASAELILAAGTKDGADVRARATWVLSELIAGLDFLFDDGVQNLSDEQLARLRETHSNVDAADRHAAALDDYAVLAAVHRDELATLGGYDVSVIGEAHELAKKLRELPNRSTQSSLSPAQREAKARRDGLALLLLERVQRVRAAARFVFRAHPEVVRRVTSDYERRRRAEHKRSQAKAEAEKKNAAAAAAEKKDPPKEG
ncbi:MAG: hypothetical protein R3A52_29390 [Polyangiales bacterium]